MYLSQTNLLTVANPHVARFHTVIDLQPINLATRLHHKISVSDAGGPGFLRSNFKAIRDAIVADSFVDNLGRPAYYAAVEMLTNAFHYCGQATQLDNCHSWPAGSSQNNFSVKETSVQFVVVCGALIF